MLNILANHNPDIKRLIEKGYAVAIDSDTLVVRDIPYLDEKKSLHIGAMVSKLNFIDKIRVAPVDHQILFSGGHPHEMDGTPIRNLGGGVTTLPMKSNDLVVQRSFSNKPPDGFKDHFEKIESYVNIICGPAVTLHGANPLTFRSVNEAVDSVFNYSDTLTSRAEIGDLAAKFANEIVIIVGLGGTGSYVLDFLTKTPVAEIRGFDLDPFHVHNAFRSPGKLMESELGETKADVYQARYEGFRKGIKLSAKYISSDSDEDLSGATFAFVCVDKGSSRKGIIDALLRLNIPFIDVGMGLQRDKGPISGTLRATYFARDAGADILAKSLVPLDDPAEDIYRTNIQIAELNAMNACLAVIRYKQLMGFYADDSQHFHLLHTIDNGTLFGLNGKD